MPTPDQKIMNLYDFDGVLGHPLEEALFQLPPTRHDSNFVDAVSQRFNMDLSQESSQSARYVCMQAIMWRYSIPIDPGFIRPDYNHPYYILTARSDFYGIRRMHRFVENELAVYPVKVQHLDHLPKGQAIGLLLERHPDTFFRFYDDNPRHITSAKMLRSDRLEIFHVDNQLKSFYEEAESVYRNKILELAL